MDLTQSSLPWRKSSHSTANSENCVEVAQLADGARAIRDSKTPSGPVLIFSGKEWRTFAEDIKRDGHHHI
ncbi:DUF397 domain-containing protein [Sphaerisporangium aureirubrum]|uniref:DUF397 domain-containing protein n=1 Tax=Sphaerisporangium aureirubrum TaxID=1544736 RepID=A0ABW1NAX4_9ACTN